LERLDVHPSHFHMSNNDQSYLLYSLPPRERHEDKATSSSILLLTAELGPRVLHQVPQGAIVPSPLPQDLPQQLPLFDFTSISDLIIPRQEFCDRLVTVCINHYRIIGHPVCIEHPRYDRNQFIFNLAFVLDEDADFSGYKSVVKKLASLFRNLEEKNGFLFKDEGELKPLVKMSRGPRLESPPLHRGAEDCCEAGSDLCGTSSLSNSIDLGGDAVQSTKVYALCEMILEDLNNYCECMIPIGISCRQQYILQPETDGYR
jgi:nitrogen permease regulator 2-like protein